jgi:hypothetical protein
MDLEKAIQKSNEAAQLISNIPKPFSKKEESYLIGVGVGLRQGSKEDYQLVFQLNSEAERSLVQNFYSKLDTHELPRIEITGRAFSLPSGATTEEIVRCRPLQVGATISVLNTDASGTLGCFVRKRNNVNVSELFFLSCAHVIAPPNNVDSIKPFIVQPGGCSENDIVARLDDFVMLSDTMNNALDAAIAKVVCEETRGINNLHESIKLTGDYAENEIPRLLNTRVFKIGGNTQLTSGWITETNLQRTIFYDDRGLQCFYQNLISIDSNDPHHPAVSSSRERFGRPGDSGSLIYDEDGYAIGLLIGGTESGIVYALPIEPILARLDIELILS